MYVYIYIYIGNREFLFHKRHTYTANSQTYTIHIQEKRTSQSHYVVLLALTNQDYADNKYKFLDRLIVS